MLSKLLRFIKSHQHPLFLGVSIVLVSMISYNIGRINALEKTPLKINKSANIYQASSVKNDAGTKIQDTSYKIQNTDLRVVVSKKSTSKKYHYLWCSGAKQIKEENKLWFNSSAEAESAGYTLAGNCEL